MESGITLYEDYRLGGEPRFVFGNPADAMRVPDEILEPGVFLYFQESGDMSERRRAIGTAFFISIRSKTANLLYPYLVTAKHCVVEPMERGDLFVRLNTTDGASAFVQVKDGWLFPDDPSSDIAVLPFGIPSELQNRFEFRTVAEAMLATEAKLKEHEVGIGDEIVISGLFTRLAAKPRNIPIVRFGNISALPTQLSDSKTGLNYHAFLAEVRSIGGLSGSPVFVVIGPGRVPPSKTMRLDRRYLMLIGVVRGHWEHKEPGIGEAGSAFADELAKVNWGITTITPVKDVLSILYGDELMKRREQSDEVLKRQDGTVEDSVLAIDHEAEQSFTQGDFEAALRKAARKKSGES